jgi:hypothetical protein
MNIYCFDFFFKEKFKKSKEKIKKSKEKFYFFKEFFSLRIRMYIFYKISCTDSKNLLHGKPTIL